MLIGYARVSTQDQNLDLQMEALTKASCKKIFDDKISGSRAVGLGQGVGGGNGRAIPSLSESWIDWPVASRTWSIWLSNCTSKASASRALPTPLTPAHLLVVSSSTSWPAWQKWNVI